MCCPVTLLAGERYESTEWMLRREWERSHDDAADQEVPILHSSTAQILNNEAINVAEPNGRLAIEARELNHLVQKIAPIRDEQNPAAEFAEPLEQMDQPFLDKIASMIDVISQKDLTDRSTFLRVAHYELDKDLMIELIAYYLPVRLDYDSWVGKNMIQQTAEKAGVPVTRILATSPLLAAGDSVIIGYSCRGAFDLAEPGELMYFPEAGDPSLDPNARKLLAAQLRLIPQVLSWMAKLTAEWFRTVVCTYYHQRLESLAEDNCPLKHVNKHVVYGYIRGVFGHRWYDLPFIKEFQFDVSTAETTSLW